eukprot:scaffold20289_cov59-Attheya_sp.AAC.2
MESPLSTPERRPRSNSSQFAQSNPVVAAMLSNNRMSDCHQVRDMYQDCTMAESSSKNSAVICDAARRYYLNCSRHD